MTLKSSNTPGTEISFIEQMNLIAYGSGMSELGSPFLKGMLPINIKGEWKNKQILYWWPLCLDVLLTSSSQYAYFNKEGGTFLCTSSKVKENSNWISLKLYVARGITTKNEMSECSPSLARMLEGVMRRAFLHPLLSHSSFWEWAKPTVESGSLEK